MRDAVTPDAETIPGLLRHRAQHEPDLRALVDDDGVITYAELDDASAAVAARLVAAGVAGGDRVGLLAPNGIAWAATAYAVMRLGAVLVPFSTLLRPPELLAQITTAQVTHLVLAPAFRGRDYRAELEEAAPGLLDAVRRGTRHPAALTLQGVWHIDELNHAASSDWMRAAPGPDGLAHPTEPTSPPATGGSSAPVWWQGSGGSAAAPGPGGSSADREALARPPTLPGPDGTGAPAGRAASTGLGARSGPGASSAGPEVSELQAAGEVVRAMGERVRAADDMVVLFTSGSTGSPKGVIHTHGGGLRAVAAGLDARCVGPGERLYIPMPFFWTGGFSGGLLTALVAGATLLTEADPEPARTLRLLERERVTLFRGWPDQAAKLAAHPAVADADLSSLGDGSLGALLPPERRPAPGTRANLFGMTESFGPYCGERLDRDLPAGKEGSCGRPFAGVEVQIADPDTGEPLPPGETGEIRLRGPNLLRGICGQPRSEVLTADGWYRTGDRGRVDEDGYLWYRGRLDDMFKVKGASVYPSEVEAALRSLDAVRQAFVTHVPTGSAGDEGVGGAGTGTHIPAAVPGVDAPREVGAVVVTDEPLDAVVAAVKERLSAFKVPTRWLLTADVADIPMTATGKVDKAALRARLREPSNTGARP